MTLTAFKKSTEQQSTDWEIQNKGCLKVEADFHLGMFIIKVSEINLLYTFYWLPVKCDSSI